MKHTKNNWRSYPEALKHNECYPEAEKLPFRSDVLGRGNGLIAKVYGQDEEDVQAKAKLIAAAPELLEALNIALKFLPIADIINQDKEAANKVINAINKATE